MFEICSKHGCKCHHFDSVCDITDTEEEENLFFKSCIFRAICALGSVPVYSRSSSDWSVLMTSDLKSCVNYHSP